MWCGNYDETTPSKASSPYGDVQIIDAPLSPADRIGLWCESAGVRIATAWLEMPPAKQRKVTRLLCAGFIAFIMLGALFMPHKAKAAGFGLDALQAQYASMGSAWMANSLALATAISGLVLTAVFSYRFFKAVGMAKGNIAVVAPGMVTVAIECVVPFLIVTGLPGVIGDLMALANSIGAVIGVPTGLTPDAVMAQGIDLGFKTFTGIMGGYLGSVPAEAAKLPPCTGSWTDQLACNIGHWASIGAASAAVAHSVDKVFIIAGIFCLCIMYCFAMLAGELLVTTIQAYITIPLAAWTFGFTGTPVQGAAGNGAGAIMGSLARWLTIFSLIAVATSTAVLMASALGPAMAPKLPTDMAGGVADVLGFNFGWLKPLASAALGMVILLKVTGKAGDLAESVMSGRGVLSGANPVSIGVGAAQNVTNATAGAGIGAATGGAGAAALGAMQGARGAASSAMLRMQPK